MNSNFSYDEVPILPFQLSRITASGGTRIMARLVDTVITLIACIPILIWSSGKSTTPLNILIISSYVIFINFIFELIVPIIMNGQSIGKRALDIRMISKSGAHATAWQLFLRSSIYTVLPIVSTAFSSFEGIITFVTSVIMIISLILIFTDEYHQAVYDKIGSIIVVYDSLYYKHLSKK